MTKTYVESQEDPLSTSSLKLDCRERISVLYMLSLIKQRSAFAINEASHLLLQPHVQKLKTLETRSRQVFLYYVNTCTIFFYHLFFTPVFHIILGPKAQAGKGNRKKEIKGFAAWEHQVLFKTQNKTKTTNVRGPFVENLSLSHQLLSAYLSKINSPYMGLFLYSLFPSTDL